MKSICTLAGLSMVSLAAHASAQCSNNVAAEAPRTASVVNASMLAADKSADIIDTAVAAGSFKTLAAALQAAGLVDALKGPGPFTVFAPTDEAFAKLPAGTVERLLKPENREVLKTILTYHVVSGDALAATVVSKPNWMTLSGQRIDITSKGGKAMVDNANIVKTDIACSNGVIHVIDTVIMPSTEDLVDTAVAAGSFKTLAAALGAAELVSTLKNDGPFTVFAPTDEAFAKLPAGTVESLLKPENRAKLIAILTYHVVPGRVYADQAVAKGSFKTVQGASLGVKVTNGQAMVDNAKILKTDIETTNGVIHVIDTVIMPKGV